jgi:hypothetical protein
LDIELAGMSYVQGILVIVPVFLLPAE